MGSKSFGLAAIDNEFAFAGSLPLLARRYIDGHLSRFIAARIGESAGKIRMR